MIRLPAALLALVLFATPLPTAPARAVTAVGVLGLALAALGVATLWRWPTTAAGGLFLIEYTVALWIARRPLDLGGALGFGLALALLIGMIEVGRAMRRARVDGRAVRSQITAWLGFALATLGATFLGHALASALVPSIPFAAAPFVAGLAAFGVVLALTMIVTGRPRVESSVPPRRRLTA